MQNGFFVNPVVVPDLVVEFVWRGIHQVDEMGGLACLKAWKLEEVPLPQELYTCPAELLAYSSMEWVASHFGSTDPRERFDAAQIVYGVTRIYIQSDQTRMIARHLAELGQEMVMVLARELGSDKERTRRLASFGLAFMGPDLEPCLPGILVAFERYPKDAALALLHTGSAGADPLASALRNGPNSRRAAICDGFLEHEIHTAARMDPRVFGALIDCIGEFEIPDHIEDANEAIRRAVRDDRSLYGHLRRRFEGSEGVLRVRLTEVLEYLAD